MGSATYPESVRRFTACAAATSSLEVVTQTTQWVTHTYEVIAQAKQILAAAVDMETGMRGYLLAGEEGFLDPYNSGQKNFSAVIGELKNTVNDNPAQVKLLSEIETTINTWVAKVTTPAIDLRREIGDSKTMNDMARVVGEARGKVYFDEFRHQIATFASREETLMAERTKAAETATVAASESLKVVIEPRA